ncbi:MAG: protein kinase domain-containing protein, partial [Thermoanaerobaculia bacterium]
MALAPGTRLGTFEILSPLGAGGMGEVYQARDTRLGREVAIKVLPEAFARDPTRAARFEREARLLAAVNHPAIAAIYGAEASGSLQYIVMELVPGETLGEKLARGALELEESLLLSRQIAEALEGAHEKGVVHRDLKPSNIKVTPEGKVKVLDLGLAKAMEPPPSEDVSKSPTIVAEQTRPGVILGTVEFMSPEQARGKPIDKRTDIWAFGCILFEMLSGKRAFSGETVSDILAAILDREPVWSALPARTPERIRELLHKCLEKDPGRRLRDAGDARLELEATLAGLSGAGAITVARKAAPWKMVAAVAAGAALAVGAWWVARRPLHLRPEASQEKYLAVLPFKDLSGSADGQLVGDGLVETVSVRLARVPGVQIVTPSAAIAVADKETDPLRIARNLGANLILRGAIQREGDQIRITYSVLNARQGVQVTGGDVTGPASDLFAMQDRLTDSVAAALKLPRGTSRTPTPSGLDTASEHERYLHALGLLQRYDKRDGIERALQILRELA